MRILLKFARAIDRLIEVLGQGADWLVILTVAVGFYNVAVRYIGRFIGLQLSSNVLIELQWYLFSIIFLLGFAYILKHDQNVRVDFWYAHWSERRKTWINLIGTVLFLIPFCILGLYVALNPVLASWGQLPDGTWGSWEVSSDANGLPRAPIKTMLLVGLALLLLQAIAQAIKYAALLSGRPVHVQQDAEQLPYE
ncbi:TRAP transporter small permease subunit [Leptolyngbya sp. FACHB-671]|uniref:TRAP transporter small permease subunit n=1 Tax=Leptolyngbya sp. FACHB-671 TaxID=2692812 RepID=UPI001683C1F9|nr:TRAP transporter small permease subunit [Leptolyngbya sp. FACHB-671]MBD2070082.1 TRAP transporter small permease subunit [Leptolyngbya sp. FACHB-671]